MRPKATALILRTSAAASLGPKYERSFAARRRWTEWSLRLPAWHRQGALPPFPGRRRPPEAWSRAVQVPYRRSPWRVRPFAPPCRIPATRTGQRLRRAEDRRRPLLLLD